MDTHQRIALLIQAYKASPGDRPTCPVCGEKPQEVYTPSGRPNGIWCRCPSIMLGVTELAWLDRCRRLLSEITIPAVRVVHEIMERFEAGRGWPHSCSDPRRCDRCSIQAIIEKHFKKED